MTVRLTIDMRHACGRFILCTANSNFDRYATRTVTAWTTYFAITLLTAFGEYIISRYYTVDAFLPLSSYSYISIYGVSTSPHVEPPIVMPHAMPATRIHAITCPELTLLRIVSSAHPNRADFRGLRFPSTPSSETSRESGSDFID